MEETYSVFTFSFPFGAAPSFGSQQPLALRGGLQVQEVTLPNLDPVEGFVLDSNVVSHVG